jgi:predicted MFS family arabinose efflux permease
VATWLRDILGYTPAQVARALLLFGIAMLLGFVGFGHAADARARVGRSALPLLAGGVAAASACLALLALGVRTGALALWAAFFCFATAVVLSYSLFSRRYPKEMAGRVNTALNVVVFIGMFTGQWAVGLVLSLWPQTAGGYAPEAYPWAIAMLWAVQFAGLAWLWTGRRLLEARA